MFQLVEMKDNVRITPAMFKKEQCNIIKEVLNTKLANKVVHNIGLAIALHDLTNVGDSFVFPGDACTYTTVRFRYTFFKPFEDEVLIGKVSSSSREGVWVTLGFFEETFIPEAYLQSPCKFDADENVWVWEYMDGGDTHNLYMDEREEIRFRVVKVEFNDIAMTKGGDEYKAKDLPMKVIGSISEPGLGLLSWWKEDNV